MRRRLHPVTLAAVLLVVVACTGTDDVAGTTTTPPTDSSISTTSVPPAVASTVAPSAPPSSVAPASVPLSTATPSTVPPEARALELCASSTSFVLGTVENAVLDEASGLVASRRHTDVFWAHNDGADSPGLFAIGPDGADLGFHPAVLDDVVDVEDIAIVSGPDGDDVLLADIGDNGAARPSIRIHRFAEPDPSVVAPITDVEVLEFVYPDRPHNAEVLLVDEANDRIVIVTKEQRRLDGVPADLSPTAPSFVFEGPLDGHDGTPIVLTPAGMLDAPQLATRTAATPPHPTSLLGIGGLPTGGDVSADGALIALRTYETIWVFPRLAGRSVADSLASDPCQAAIAPEPQGEAVAFRGPTVVTVSEGVNPNLFELRP